jgi:hypothetical protein
MSCNQIKGWIKEMKNQSAENVACLNLNIFCHKFVAFKNQDFFCHGFVEEKIKTNLATNPWHIKIVKKMPQISTLKKTH